MGQNMPTPARLAVARRPSGRRVKVHRQVSLGSPTASICKEYCVKALPDVFDCSALTVLKVTCQLYHEDPRVTCTGRLKPGTSGFLCGYQKVRKRSEYT